MLAALLVAPKNGLSVADLARKTRFTKPNVAFAVDALVLAGLLEAGVALEVLRFAGQDQMSPSVRTIEARRVVESLQTRILSEGLPQPNTDAFGDEFSSAFDRWVVQLVDNLRNPSRTYSQASRSPSHVTDRLSTGATRKFRPLV